MIWFTLGNISVEGTYYTHVLNLTPRGLLAVTAAAMPLSCAAALLYRTVRVSRWDSYRIGYPLSLIFFPLLFNNLSTAASSRPILAASSQLFSSRPAAASCQLAASPAVILPVYSQDLVI